jgi:hypothetical protein
MTLTFEEMIEILEGIAREANNAAARIAAIKTLMAIAPAEPDTGIWADWTSWRHGETNGTKAR